MTTCATCHQDYNEADEKTTQHHTDPVDCEQSCRCNGKPGCYLCGGSFCMCAAH